MKKYLCKYRYKGVCYSLTIEADSMEDATERLKVISYGELSGELISEISTEALMNFPTKVFNSIKRMSAPDYPKAISKEK